jgi:release factor glutamine methyltransferase
VADKSFELSALSFGQTIGDLVEAVAARLSGHVVNPKAQSRELIAALFDEPKHWPLVKANKWVESTHWQLALAAADKRARGAPLAYAVGRANFRNLTLAVDERVLIPRPETELLVDLVLRRAPAGTALDVGTGSGAIAIALATEGKYDRVVASDISIDALEVAKANAVACGASIEFVHANLLGVETGRSHAEYAGRADEGAEYSVVVSNPPYIALGEAAGLPTSVRNWEPSIALFSGHDGMAATARLVKQSGLRLAAGGLLALEVDSRRASLVAELLASDGRYEDITVELDLTGRERFVLATRRS